MCYGHSQTQLLSEWDLMAISTIWHSESSWGESQRDMRLALGVPEDGRWTRYTENLSLLAVTIWVEFADLLKTQALEAINHTQPKHQYLTASIKAQG